MRQFSRTAVRQVNIGSGLLRAGTRQILPLVIAIGFVALLSDRVAALDYAQIWSSLRSVTALQWVTAVAATSLSFWAVGRYDAILHRHLRSGVRADVARRAGVTAIAVSQTVGLGLFSGALVRWRLIPELSLWQATRLSAMVALSFLAGWAVITACILLVLPAPLPQFRTVAVVTLAALAIVIALSLVAPRAPFRWPSLLTIAAILGFTLVDTLAAGSALYILLPDTISLSFSVLLPAYMLALGAALIGGTPGGVGPFEVALLALLPHIQPESLLAAIVAFRAVYYGLPACLGALALLRGPAPASTADTAPAPVATTPDLAPHVYDAPRAEAQLVHQPGKSVLWTTSGTPMMVGSLGQSLIAVSDPFKRGAERCAIGALQQAARGRNQVAAVYKCGARMAVMARASGFCVLPVAQEAWLSPETYTTNTPSRRQLRRKLRKAADAGVTVRPATSPLPLDQMSAISEAWVKRNGAERGFSMNRFCRDQLAGQKIYLAFHQDRLVGFLSLHHTKAERTVDVMRLASNAPDGTMHALVDHAIRHASADGCPRVSLAAVPCANTGRSGVVALILAALDRASGGAGLRQFKNSFAPNWETLYFAAPSRTALSLAAFDIVRAITNPAEPGQSSQMSSSL